MRKNLLVELNKLARLTAKHVLVVFVSVTLVEYWHGNGFVFSATVPIDHHNEARLPFDNNENYALKHGPIEDVATTFDVNRSNDDDDPGLIVDLQLNLLDPTFIQRLNQLLSNSKLNHDPDASSEFSIKTTSTIEPIPRTDSTTTTTTTTTTTSTTTTIKTSTSKIRPTYRNNNNPNRTNHNEINRIIINGDDVAASRPTAGLTFLKLPLIFNSINEKTRQIFVNFKVYFLILFIVLVVLILSTMILMLVNFVVNRNRHHPTSSSSPKKSLFNYSRKKKNERDDGNSNGKQQHKKFKKKTLSFDIIDNGYRQNRITAGSSSFKFFGRSTSTNSNLVVDHDYHFEDFTNLNRTYDRINDSVDNFYELPYIDASTTEFKTNTNTNSGGQKPSSSVANVDIVATVMGGISNTVNGSGSTAAAVSKWAGAMGADSLKFKTFSAKKFDNQLLMKKFNGSSSSGSETSSGGGKVKLDSKSSYASTRLPASTLMDEHTNREDLDEEVETSVSLTHNDESFNSSSTPPPLPPHGPSAKYQLPAHSTIYEPTILSKSLDTSSNPKAIKN